MGKQVDITEFTAEASEANENEKVRLKHLARINPTKSEVSDLDPDTEVSFVGLEDFGTDGEIKKTETRALEEVYDGYTYFREGDIAIAKITPSFENGKGAICRGLKNSIGFGTTELHVLRPRKGVSTEYLWYVLRSKPFMDEAETAMRGVAGQQRVPTEMLANFKIYKPTLEYQRKIASNINRETTRIDDLINYLNSVSDMLVEYKYAYYLKTLMGDSPSEISNPKAFASSTPEGWRSPKLKWIADVIDTKHRTAEYVDEGIPIISPSEVSSGVLEIEKANRTTKEEYLDLIEDGRKPQPGDIIYSRNASVGNAVLVTSDKKMCMGQDLCLIRSDFGRYLYHVLNSPIVTSQVEAKTVGATFDRINVSAIKEFTVPLPPEEQIENTTSDLNNMKKLIDSSMERLSQLEELLLERRESYITNTVDGQIGLNT